MMNKPLNYQISKKLFSFPVGSKLSNKFQTQILKQDSFLKKENLKGGGNVDTGNSSDRSWAVSYFYTRMKTNDAFL